MEVMRLAEDVARQHRRSDGALGQVMSKGGDGSWVLSVRGLDLVREVREDFPEEMTLHEEWKVKSKLLGEEGRKEYCSP